MRCASTALGWEGSVNGQEAGRTVHEESTTPNERRSGVGSSTDVVFQLVQWLKIALIVILVAQLDTNITMKLKCSKSPEKEKSKSNVEVAGPLEDFSRWCTYLGQIKTGVG